MNFIPSVLSRADLVATGMRARDIRAAIDEGRLLRLRRDRYCIPSLDDGIQRAVRVGGLATCVTALAAHNIFTVNPGTTHVRLRENASRLRLPAAEHSTSRGDTILHWRPQEPVGHGAGCVTLVDALADAFICQAPVHALASLDNAIHLGLLRAEETASVFERVPRRLRRWRRRVDGRAESGQETVLRELVRDLGFRFELQVPLPGRQRGDILVEGCLLLEADSRLAHDGWENHVRDRGRDLTAASLGYMSLRPAYQHTMYHPRDVQKAILGLLGSQSISPRYGS